MNQEIKTIAFSKNECQNLGALQNCSLKNCISEHWYTLRLLPQKMHFGTLVHIKTAPSKKAFQNMGAYRFQQMITNKKVSPQVLSKNDVGLY